MEIITVKSAWFELIKIRTAQPANKTISVIYLIDCRQR